MNKIIFNLDITSYQALNESTTKFINRLDFKPQHAQDMDGNWPSEEFKKYVDSEHTYKAD